MNFFAKIITPLAAIAAALFSAGNASAQQATFHLDRAAVWNGVTLPAGSYRLHMPQAGPVTNQFTLDSTTSRMFIVPMSVDAYGGRSIPNGSDYLQLVRVNGTYYVRKYESKTKATAYYFNMPKVDHKLQISMSDTVRVRMEGM